ncbi:uncharacterized protein AMSG_06568 [Thecamonas trahens ATCC 50062]|uniref:Uncharacterized protein n=1 Tax=Thecamonas trahens ATCC 50062 TaxID=461836 RepID=A0A0L0DGG6_THETB|nr:hypothetical protein AMSG_06568 [Thecamonas trahens ATCC 50062]KNC51211.1 hypothetical protein AMSG_06568 [Thecamonas trahens ATCC 50062]|eukprot:XP_013756408.1 hypothetical protein AMSG_06568 [Thecamonas trahens ATCC 50062]
MDAAALRAQDGGKDDEPLSDNVLIRRRQVAARAAERRKQAEEAELKAKCTFKPKINATSAVVAAAAKDGGSGGSGGQSKGSVYAALTPAPVPVRSKNLQRMAADYATGSPFAFTDYVEARGAYATALIEAETATEQAEEVPADHFVVPSPRTTLPHRKQQLDRAKKAVMLDFKAWYGRQEAAGKPVEPFPDKASAFRIIDRLAASRQRARLY